MKTPAAQSSESWGARASSPAVFGVPPNTFPVKPRLHYFLSGSTPKIVAALYRAPLKSQHHANCLDKTECLMKKIHIGLLLLALALAAPARATDGGVPANYTGTAVDNKAQPALSPSANIEGKVIIAGSGQPLSGVKLRWVATNGLRDPVLSGPDGSFRISGLTDGMGAITAEFPGEPFADWVAEDLSLTLAPGETKKGLIVRALKGGIAVVRVLSWWDEQRPLVNVPVTFSNELSPSPVVALTGADGFARVRLLPDIWDFCASDGGGADNAGQDHVTVLTGQTSQVEVRMGPAMKLTGTVYKPDGKPAPGAVVSLEGSSVKSEDATTDSNGRYELRWWYKAQSGLGTTQDDRFYARTREHNFSVIRYVDEGPTNQDLTLQPSISLSVTVADALGRPVTNAEVSAIIPTNGFVPIEPYPCTTDSRGHAEFTGVPRADRYDAYVFAQGRGWVGDEMQMPARQTNRLEFPTFVLPLANLKLGGKIVGTDGQPVEGAEVRIFAISNVIHAVPDKPDAWDVEPVRLQILGHVTTGGDGGFFLPEVCEGPVQLVISFQGYSGKAQTVAGTTNVLLRLGPGGVELSKDNGWVQRAPLALKISGTVRDPSGAPASGVLLSWWDDCPERQEVKTDSDGRYSLELARESYNPGLTVFARDVRRNLTARHTIGDNLTNVDLTLQPGVAFSVKAQDVNGLPIQSATVILAVALDNRNLTRNWNYQLRTDENGLVEFKAMPQGVAYLADVTARGFNDVTATVSAAKMQTNHYTFHPAVLRLAERKLGGQVVGPDNKPIAGVEVVLNFDGEVMLDDALWSAGDSAPVAENYGGEVMLDDAGNNGIFQEQGHLWVEQGWNVFTDGVCYGSTQMRTHSDTDGRFSFEGLCEGTYHLLLSKDAVPDETGLGPADSSAELKLQAGDTNILFKLGPANGVPAVVPVQP
jgi:hypothetical protein